MNRIEENTPNTFASASASSPASPSVLASTSSSSASSPVVDLKIDSKTIIIILQKLIKNLCKTIKTIALTDKCSSCDD